MGIKNLHKFLLKYAPNCYEKKHLSEFSYQRIAIDISLYLYKYKALSGDKWMESFIYLISSLRKWNIHCIFVYDNKAPIEKLKEQHRRREVRSKQNDKILELEKELEAYKNGEKPSEKIKEIIQLGKVISLLKKDNQSIILNHHVKMIEDKIKNMKSVNISITEQDLQLTRELFDILKIPYTTAISEAEAYCSYLSIHKKVDGVLSEDTDVLVYGSPLFLTKINTFDDTVICINHEKMLSELNMTKESFVDLCIMIGCDYNSNIPKIGLEKSFSFIKTYKNIDEIQEIKETKEILNHKRCRELFSIPESIDFNVPYCDIPDFNQIHEFFFKNHLSFNINKLKKNLGKSELSFIE